MTALSTHFSFQPPSESVKCPARAVIAKSRARHVHVMSLNLLTSRRSPLILPRTTDKSLHFRSSFRKPKRFWLALHLRKCRLLCNTVTQGHLVDQNFLQRYTRIFEIRRRAL